jgi:hypothetical protein
VVALVAAIEVAAPAVPVAVNVTGLPLRVPEVAVRVFVPAVGPRVQETAVAMPLVLVDTGVVGFTVPPPAVTAKVTATFATGLLFASRTITDGGAPTALPTVADCVVALVAAIEAAAPALRVIVPDVTLVREPEVKLKV